MGDEYKIEQQKRKLCKGGLGRPAENIQMIKTTAGNIILFPFGYIYKNGQILNPAIKRNKYGKRLRQSKKERLRRRSKGYGKEFKNK